MAANTKIEWADHTFNPWIGCTKVSAGCANCYAEEMMDHRYGKVKWGDAGTRVVTSDSNWKMPLKWDREAKAAGVKHRVFCASLADVFEDREELILPRARLMRLIRDTPNLIWMLLTKRPEYAWAWSKINPLPPNVWMGTSVENQAAADERIPWLLRIEARVHFLSMEPLLGLVKFKPEWMPHEFNREPSCEHCEQCVGRDRWQDIRPGNHGPFIDWVIVGGESGTKARPMHPMWVNALRNQCVPDVSFFFKQWGEYGDRQSLPMVYTPVASGIPMDEPAPMFRLGKKRTGRLLNGREWNEVPHG